MMVRDVKMIKKIRVEVSGKFGTNGLMPSLPAGTQVEWDCNVLTTLLWIGILTTPPTYRGFDLSTFWAWLRYASAISDGSTDLRLKPIWTDIDAHQKNVMSDDFGMGFSCHYLAEQHGIQAFANTGYLLDQLVGVTALRPSKRGPAKSPDFIGIDASGGLHILECKGSQSSRAYLWKAVERGVSQKSNFTNSTPFASCMVGGIFVPQHQIKEDALLLFVDPEPDHRLTKMVEMSPQKIAVAIYRISLAKELMTAGLWRTATAVSGAELAVIQEAHKVKDQVVEDELKLVGYVHDNGSWYLVRDYRSVETDVDIESNGSQFKAQERKTSLRVEVSEEVVEFIKKIRTLDSKGEQDRANKVIVDRFKNKSKKHKVHIRLRRESEAEFHNETRQVDSVWNEQKIGQKSAALTGPSGIKFILTREFS